MGYAGAAPFTVLADELAKAPEHDARAIASASQMGVVTFKSFNSAAFFVIVPLSTPCIVASIHAAVHIVRLAFLGGFRWVEFDESPSRIVRCARVFINPTTSSKGVPFSPTGGARIANATPLY